MLTAKQHELLRFIQRKLEDTGISPSFEEMKDALDLKSKSGVHRLISALEERGFLRRLPNRARALEVLRQPEDVTAGSRKSANDAVSRVTAPPAAAPPACRSKRWKATRCFPCPRPCSARATITRSKYRAIR